MSITGRSSGFGVILGARLPAVYVLQWHYEHVVARYGGATAQDFHLLPYSPAIGRAPVMSVCENTNTPVTPL